MKKNKLKVIQWLNMGSYPGYTVFIMGFSFDEVKKILKKKKALDWLNAFNHAIKLNTENGCWANGTTMENIKTAEIKYYYFIYIPAFDFKDYDYIKLSHEVLHICQFYLPAILDRNKEHEAECYLHSHLMQQCLNAIRND